MTSSLKELIGKITIGHSIFSDMRSEKIADEIYKRHTLQSVLESLSDRSGNKQHTVNSSENIEYFEKVHLLIANCNEHWILEFENGFNDSDTLALCIGSLRTVSRTASEQFDKDKEVYLLEQKDFEAVKERAERSLKIFSSLYTKVGLLQKSSGISRCCGHIVVYSMLIICHHLENNMWTSDELNRLSKNLVQEFMSYFGYLEIKDILIMDISGQTSAQPSFKSSIFGRLLAEWKPFLVKDKWRQNPMTVAAFTFCLHRVTFPQLSEFIEYVLPPSLLFLDDYMTRNKIMGIECIVHIIKNSSAEELRWYGRADVIYEALKHQMFSTEETVLQLTYPALLEVLKVLVKPASDLSDSTKYDEVLQMMLQSAAHENKLALRRIHTEHMYLFFERMGIHVIKHLQSILNLVEEYLDISDAPSEQSRTNVLKALQSLIIVAWPRIKCHVYVLSKSLIKLIHSLTSDGLNISEDIKSQLIDDTEKCLDLLIAVDHASMQGLLRAARETNLSDKCLSTVESLLSKC